LSFSVYSSSPEVRTKDANAVTPKGPVMFLFLFSCLPCYAKNKGSSSAAELELFLFFVNPIDPFDTRSFQTLWRFLGVVHFLLEFIARVARRLLTPQESVCPSPPSLSDLRFCAHRSSYVKAPLFPTAPGNGLPTPDWRQGRLLAYSLRPTPFCGVFFSSWFPLLVFPTEP